MSASTVLAANITTGILGLHSREGMIQRQTNNAAVADTHKPCDTALQLQLTGADALTL